MAEFEASSGEVISTGLGSMSAKMKYCTGNYDPFNAAGPSSCFCVRFSPCNRYLAVSFSSGVISVYDADTGELENTLTSASNASHSAVAMQLRWKPNSLQLMSVTANADLDGQVTHWHTQSGKCLSTITERGNQLLCSDYFIDGSRFATAGYDRTPRVYDDKTRRELQTLSRGDGYTTNGHSNHIFSVKCHPGTSNIIFTGGWDNTVQFWDTRQEKSIRSLSNCFICGDTLDFDISRDCLLTGSHRSTDALQMWDFGTGKLVETVSNHTDSIDTRSMLFAAQYSKDAGSRMIGAGGHQVNEAKLLVQEADGTKVFAALVGLEKPVFSLDFAHNSQLVAVGVADGLVRVLELSTRRDY